jgi:RNA-binding protein YhbY
MVEIKGNEKRAIRAVLKTRPVDLKIGKRGLTPEFLRECAKVLGRDSMIKLGLPADKELQNKLMEDFTEETSTMCIAKVGKTAAFYQSNE